MNFLNLFKKGILILGCLLLVFSFNLNKASGQEKIGVLFVFHGGAIHNETQYFFDAVIHMFTYDPNHPVYKYVIWDSANWPGMLGPDATDFGLRFMRMYDFEYEVIGGFTPFHYIADEQLQDMEDELDINPYGIDFEVDWASYMAGEHPDHYAYPRFLYDGPGGGDNFVYCGEGEEEDVILGFDAGTEEFTEDATLTGQTSGATAVIDEVTVTSGSWGGNDAAGYISLSSVSVPGTSFEDNETIVDDGAGPGEATADGTTKWPGCDPERYNVDGPVERLLNKGVSRIIVIDWTMGGPRFSKTYDVVEMTKRALDDWNAVHEPDVPIIWVNDYSNLMERSYPTEPEGWTRVLSEPTVDSHVLLNGSPNPVASDPMVVTLHVEAIEDAFSDTVSDANTGVMLFNHALHDYNEYFDPKVNDTLIINKNIKSQLLSLHPTMDPDNIIGAFGGIQEVNPENGLEERNREMYGESYGHAWLYETDKVLPGDEWGYRYWDALEHLMSQGVQHIVISFPQVVTDDALNMVEIFNQLAGRTIGYKNWLKWGTWDYTRYPTVGHPFADYWGNWVNTDCGEWDLDYTNGTSEFPVKPSANPNTLTGSTSGATGVLKWLTLDSGSWTGGDAAGTLTLKEVSGTFQSGEIITGSRGGSALADGAATQISKTECCFEMGGCGDPLRPYPPLRQTPIIEKMSDLDPSLCFDVSEYGLLGYDPGMGAPDPNSPVQDQYTGTWEIYIPPNGDDRVGQLLADHVLNAAVNPMVYITNGDLVECIDVEESVTFEAHVVSGTPAYSYEWSIKEEEDLDWSTVGGNSSTWEWNPGSEEEGIYSVRCSVTDSLTRTSEVIWEGFVVGDADGDCVANIEDNCPYDINPTQTDTDGDCVGDVCDPDLNDPDIPVTLVDTDSDGIGDACDECTDTDGDGYGDEGFPNNTCEYDNCPNNPNGYSAGSCTRGPRAFIGDPCTIPGDNTSECGTNGFCSMAQEDTLPPPSGNSSPPTANCGDACECEGDFDNNGVQDGADAITFKTDFGRFNCMIAPPCKGDFDCSGVVDGQDAIKFKIDFGRFDCPDCAKVPWCPYE